MEETGITQNAFPPIGRRIMQHDQFSGNSFIAHLELYLEPPLGRFEV